MPRRRFCVALFGFAAALLVRPLAQASSEEVAPARFHHVHLNVTDPKQSIAFYRRVFGALPVKYRGQDALFTERSFLLLNKVDKAPESKLNTGIWHIGWGGVDVKNEYEWWKNHDVEIHTPLSPLPGKDNYYMYISGPDKELIEINTMGHHRFAHVHFLCSDVNASTAWYARHLGLKPVRAQVAKPRGDMATLASIWMNFIRCDNVQMIFFGKPDGSPSPPWWPDEPLKEIQPTKDRPIGHLGFSYENIAPVYERMKAAGVEIVSPLGIDETTKTKSFQVLAPDKVTVEIIEARPIPLDEQ